VRVDQQSAGTVDPVQGVHGQPGWYADPDRPGEQRWWDGLRWAPRGMAGYRNALLDLPAPVPATPAPPPRQRRHGKVASAFAFVVGGVIGVIGVNAAFDAWRARDDTAVTSAPTHAPAAGDARVTASGVSLMLPAGWHTLAATPDQIASTLAKAKTDNPALSAGLSQLQASAAKGYVVLFAARPSRVRGGSDSLSVQLMPRQGLHPSDVLPGLAGALGQMGATRVSALETVASGRQAIRITCLLTVRDSTGRHTQEEVIYGIFGSDKVAIITVSETRDVAGHATRAATDAAEMSAFVTFG